MDCGASFDVDEVFVALGTLAFLLAGTDFVFSAISVAFSINSPKPYKLHALTQETNIPPIKKHIAAATKGNPSLIDTKAIADTIETSIPATSIIVDSFFSVEAILSNICCPFSVRPRAWF